MSDFKTWLQAIDANKFGPWTREMLIREAQRTHFVGSLPTGFEFLRGAVADLGFDKLGLADQELNELRLAFVGTGVTIPSTSYRVRCFRPAQSVVEPADGTEQATLPVHWRQGVIVLGHHERYTWLGRLVPQDQLGGLDLGNYEEDGDGWLLRVEEPDLPIITSG
jgi:hypothetical protein